MAANSPDTEVIIGKKVRFANLPMDDVHIPQLVAARSELETVKNDKASKEELAKFAAKKRFDQMPSLPVMVTQFQQGVVSDLEYATVASTLEDMKNSVGNSVKDITRRVARAKKEVSKKMKSLGTSTTMFKKEYQRAWSTMPAIKNMSFTASNEGVKMDIQLEETPQCKSNEENNKDAVGPKKSYASAVNGNKKREPVILDEPIEFCPPTILESGEKVALIQPMFLEQAEKDYKTQMYGYFVGVDLHIRDVRANLYRMWKRFGVTDIATNRAGVYFFKFRNEEGLMEVLKAGPWVVNGVPLCIQKWRVGMHLTKQEPETIPVWTTLKNLPLELWNIKCICQISSCIGKPITFDNVTAERCMKKNGVAGFARVLIEINAKD